jgi:hypothetical protein
MFLSYQKIYLISDGNMLREPRNNDTLLD